MNSKTYARFVAGLIAGWFVFVLWGSARNLFVADPNLPPLALGLAVVIPVAIFLSWFGASVGFRQFVMSLNPRILTFVHEWRIAGLTFLALYSLGILPGIFALPAGWGDIAIGATAPLAALQLATFQRRNWFILWQALGILDLVTAIALGTTVRFIDPHAAATGVMTTLPMSLIPTFGVPLMIVLHIVCIAQARRWTERESVGAGEPALAIV